MDKREFNQPIWWVILSVSLLIAYIVLDHLLAPVSHSLTLSQLVVDVVILVAILVNFYKIRINVCTDHIAVAYGVGLINHRIDLEQVETVQIVRNRTVINLNLKTIYLGATYNWISRNALLLHFKNSRRVVSIGCNCSNAKQLKTIVGAQLKSKQS